MEHIYDVAIIGGGINGCGCAADAALRGLSVLLCEQDDLASKTSSSSSQLIHGGLRYLENFDFGLVRKALDERQKLLQLAPHLVHPQLFVLPHQKNTRPLWMLRAGLFVYDYLSQINQLPHCKFIQRQQNKAYFSPLAEPINKGFLFYDCATDDARLTLANALQAKEYGATIMTHTTLIEARAIDKQWQLLLQPDGAPPVSIRTKSIINATGPWVEKTNQMLQIPLQQSLSLVKGSHVVVRQLYKGEHAYLLQHNDKRIVFTIPYHGYTLIGTTEVFCSSIPDSVDIDAREKDYLLTLVSQHFENPLTAKDIVHCYSGIRPLLSMKNKSARTLSRDYAYQYSTNPAPAVTLYGGKITTYRKLALHAVDQLRAVFPNLSHSFTDTIPLPGARLNSMNFTEYQRTAQEKYAWLDEETRLRYLNTYGTYIEKILARCTKMTDLGSCFTPTLYQVEIDYLLKEEWARTCDDILWRRTKLGLHIDKHGKKILKDYIKYKQSKEIPNETVVGQI